MRISKDVAFKLVVAMWSLGMVKAQESRQNISTTPVAPLPSTTATTSTAMVPLKPDQSQGPPMQTTSWNIQVPVVFGTEAVFEYSAGPEALKSLKSLGSSRTLLLVQTRAVPPEQVDSSNSWVVVQLRPCLKGEICTQDFVFDDPPEEMYPFGWAFEKNKHWPDAEGYQNFFLCWAHLTNGSSPTCQLYSDFFDIESPDQSAGIEQGSRASGVESGIDPGGTQRGVDEDIIRSVTIALEESTLRSSLSTPIGELSLSVQTPVVTYDNIPDIYTPTTTQATRTSATSTTATAKVTVSPSSQAGDTAAGTGSGSGLSTGAKVGIALGVLVVTSLLTALALFFCLKKRRRQRNGAPTHEQVMLTHAQGENNSQDLLAEKDAVITTLIHPSSNDSTFSRHDQDAQDSSMRQTLFPASEIDRHHSTRESLAACRGTDEIRQIHPNPYNAENHIPSSNTAFVAATSSTPRRVPTNASIAPSAVSALSRNTSSSTTISRPRSSSLEYQHHALQDIGEETSPIMSMAGPRYGDARYTPTFHTGPSTDGEVTILQPGGHRSSTAVGGAGFLSEPGMSDEEVARLEEEERRIDEAIAAADALRARERGLR